MMIWIIHVTRCWAVNRTHSPTAANRNWLSSILNIAPTIIVASILPTILSNGRWTTQAKSFRFTITSVNSIRPMSNRFVCRKEYTHSTNSSNSSIPFIFSHLVSGTIHRHISDRIVVQRKLHAVRSRNRWIEKWNCMLYNGLASVLEPMGVR